MKNTVLQSTLFILIGLSTFAQTGIGTVTPQQSSVLDLTATEKALLLTRVDNTSLILVPQNGMIVYDKAAACIKVYQNGEWSDCIYANPGIISSINCTPAPNSGELKQGVAALGVYSVIAYTGGNGASHAGQTIASTGVTGLTATLNQSNFVSGDGTLLYHITGTPSATGTVNFAINIGGMTCILSRTVMPPSGSVASLDCAGAVHSGTLKKNTAASSVTSQIAYEGGNEGDYQLQTIPATGVTGLTATLVAGSLNSGSGMVVLTITGTPATDGIASFQLNLGGKSCAISRTVAPDIANVSALNCSGVTQSGTVQYGTDAVGFSFTVPYTAGNGGEYAAQNINSTGVTGLTASLDIGFLAVGNGNLTFTVTGMPSSAGNASFPINIAGKSCTVTVVVAPQPGYVSTLDCAGGTRTGTVLVGTVASGASYSILYTGGNAGAYPSLTVASTGVTGLTASLSAGTLTASTGTLTFAITGTASALGSAIFNFTTCGQSCTFIVPVIQPAGIPSSITLVQNQQYMVSSIYDTDYLPYTAPTVAATSAPQDANGIADPVVDFQGILTTTGINIKIPATATASGTLPAYTTNPITIPAALTQDGVARDVVLSWASQAYTSATKIVNATLKTVTGTLNVKKLDINSGLGNDLLGVLLGTINYPFNSSNTTTGFALRAVSGIPDKMFGIADNSGSVSAHRFMYLPVIGEDGKIWLNNNLGADYSNANKPASFDPAKQASINEDYLAFGSLFQWGRKADGHELVSWTAANAGTPVNGTTATKSDIPVNALFITMSATPSEWRVNPSDTLWATEASTNNPCPIGFRIPTQSEFSAYITSAGLASTATAPNAKIKFSYARYRNFGNGNVIYSLPNGYYWTSNISGSNAIYAEIQATPSIAVSTPRAYGQSVRCIKN